MSRTCWTWRKNLKAARASSFPESSCERNFDRLVFSAVPARMRKYRSKLRKPELGRRTNLNMPISLPGSSKTSCIVVPEIRRRFNLKVVDWPSASGETIAYRGALDFDRLRWPLILRNWRPGDSYRPHGHRRVRKLKRLFLESRVPLAARATWPVLTSAGQLVWASGYPVAEGLRRVRERERAC